MASTVLCLSDYRSKPNAFSSSRLPLRTAYVAEDAQFYGCGTSYAWSRNRRKYSHLQCCERRIVAAAGHGAAAARDAAAGSLAGEGRQRIGRELQRCTRSEYGF